MHPVFNTMEYYNPVTGEINPNSLISQLINFSKNQYMCGKIIYNSHLILIN